MFFSGTLHLLELDLMQDIHFYFSSLQITTETQKKGSIVLSDK